MQIAKDLKENTAQGSTVVVSEAEKQEAQRQILIYMQNGPDPADEARRAAALEELRNRPKKKRGRVPKVRIRRVSTPFNLYCNDQRDIVKAVNPDISFGELGKLLGANWKSSDEATKAKYRALFEEKRTAADLTKAQTQTQAVGSTKVVQSEEYIASVPTPSSSSSSASVPTTITVTAAAAASVPVDDTIRMEFDEEAEDPVSLVTRAPTPAPKPAAKAAAASAAARAAPSVKKQKTTHPPVASAAAVVANTASIPTPAPAPAPAPKPTPVVKAAVAATKATKAVPAAKMIPAAKAAKAAATAAAAAAMASSSSPTTAAASAPKEVSPRVAAPKTKTPAVKNADKS